MKKIFGVFALSVSLLAPTATFAMQKDDKMADGKMADTKMSDDKMSHDKMGKHKGKKKKAKKMDSMMSTTPQ